MPGQSGGGPSEFEYRMATSAEAKQMLLGNLITVMRECLEDQHMHNTGLGNMLSAQFNAAVVSVHELTEVVREGMASLTKVAPAEVANEKLKTAAFEKLVRRSGAIYSGLVAAGTVPPPVRTVASDVDVAVSNQTTEAATAVEPGA